MQTAVLDGNWSSAMILPAHLNVLLIFAMGLEFVRNLFKCIFFVFKSPGINYSNPRVNTA